MSYESALEAAGAAVLQYKSFGSYQGEWVALVDYKGERGWVQGSYGSCSHCDAFEAEFGWDADEQNDYQQRLASFGESHLGGLETTEQVAEYFDRNAEWDSESEEAAKWIRETAVRYGVMNKQEYIRHLAVRSGIDDVLVPKDALEKFAELIVKECARKIEDMIDNGWYADTEQLKKHFGVKE